jgi:hypothetical protein
MTKSAAPSLAQVRFLTAIQAVAARRNTMATEISSNTAGATNDDPYYEKLASEEELYLEETEEELRSRLLSDGQDESSSPAMDPAVGLNR